MTKYVIYCHSLVDGYVTEGYIKGFNARTNHLYLTYTKSKAKLFDDKYEANIYYEFVTNRHFISEVCFISVER